MTLQIIKEAIYKRIKNSSQCRSQEEKKRVVEEHQVYFTSNLQTYFWVPWETLASILKHYALLTQKFLLKVPNSVINLFSSPLMFSKWPAPTSIFWHRFPSRSTSTFGLASHEKPFLS
jgi:hypothetical protein